MDLYMPYKNAIPARIANFQSIYSVNSKIFSLNRATRMIQAFGLKVGILRQFWSGMRTKINFFAVNPNSRPPSPVIRASRDTQQATGKICFWRYAPILVVLFARNVAQIRQLIVRPASIYVVNLQFWPLTMHIEPYQTMGDIRPAIDCNANISIDIQASSDSANFYFSTAHAPSKISGFGIVMKQFAQALCGDNRLSHDTGLSLIGQRPACASYASRASLF